MTARTKFVKDELSKIYNLLNASYDYAVYYEFEDEESFKKIFELLMEISEKSNTLQKVVRGKCFI